MKRSPLIAAALLIVGAASLAFAPAMKKSMPLEQAIAQNLVTAEVVSVGGYSGDCVRLKLENQTNKNLEIVVDAGTLLYPSDEGDQTLLVPEQQILALQKEDGHRYKLDGYCTEQSDKAPAEGSSFAIGATKNKQLQKLANYLNAHPEVLQYEDAIQSAVWAITDSASISAIYEEDKQAVADLRKEVCKITGRPNVWYNTKTRQRMQGDRAIITEPMQVSGELTITSDRNMSVTSYVLNEDNEVMLARENATRLPAGRANFTFNLFVMGWAEGDYKVIYVNQRDTVLKQPFRIG